MRIRAGRVLIVVDGGAGFSVTPAALASAEAAAKTASGNVNSAAQARLTGATPQVIAGHPGWQSSAALRDCLRAWETRLRQLSAEVGQISQNLNATADGYAKAEAQAVADIQRVAAGLDGPAK